jgi:DNA-binding PadR family transcriptional regulator
MALSHAILSVLINAPCSGYDLAKQFDESVGYFWTASHQQIYRELTKLEAEGYIQAQVIHQSNRPDKKSYQVTEQGRHLLTSWIAEPSDIPALKDDLLVKLYAGEQVQPEVLMADLVHHRDLHQERLETYKTITKQWFSSPKDLPRGDRYRYMTLQCGIQFETQWLAWCEEVMRLLESER